MTSQIRKLANPPIVEAVLDIDCDLPRNLEIQSLEKPARHVFKCAYPKFETRFMFEHEFRARDGVPQKTATRREIRGYLLRKQDGKQLVQVRAGGFSFNRLAPYCTLDDYLPEIQETWEAFREIAHPTRVRTVRLRYINRLKIPSAKGLANLDDYLRVGPRLPEEDRFTFKGFLNQHLAIEAQTGNEVKIILSSQKAEDGFLPIILDIAAANGEPNEPEDWPQILLKIQSLRKLKNDIFYNTVTEKCLQPFL